MNLQEMFDKAVAVCAELAEQYGLSFKEDNYEY